MKHVLHSEFGPRRLPFNNTIDTNKMILYIYDDESDEVKRVYRDIKE